VPKAVTDKIQQNIAKALAAPFAAVI